MGIPQNVVKADLALFALALAQGGDTGLDALAQQVQACAAQHGVDHGARLQQGRGRVEKIMARRGAAVLASGGGAAFFKCGAAEQGELVVIAGGQAVHGVGCAQPVGPLLRCGGH